MRAVMPAMFTRMSMRPKSRWIFDRAATASLIGHVAAICHGPPPQGRRSRRWSRHALQSRSITATSAPKAASPTVAALPNPAQHRSPGQLSRSGQIGSSCMAALQTASSSIIYPRRPVFHESAISSNVRPFVSGSSVRPKMNAKTHTRAGEPENAGDRSDRARSRKSGNASGTSSTPGSRPAR